MTMRGNDSTHAVELIGVARRYDVGGIQVVTALDGVDVTVAPGTTVALWGPSGSGKSTLLQLVGALDRPDEGEIVVQGQRLGALSGKALAAYRRGVGFVFQRFNLLPALTVLDNVTAPVLPYRVSFDKRARARDLLERVGLAGREGALPSRLSGGQQQRVAIARALIGSPRLILADEPTGNLDSRTGAGIIDLLLETRERDAITVLIATHDLRVAQRCDRVVGLADGRVVSDVDVGGHADLAAALGAGPPDD
jgi:putative ABC transport system ATP-binding protein